MANRLVLRSFGYYTETIELRFLIEGKMDAILRFHDIEIKFAPML